MSESEQQFHEHIKESWRWVRLYMIGSVSICLLLVVFPPFPITTEINWGCVGGLATATSIAYAMTSFIIVRTSYILLRHRLMILYSNSGLLLLFGYVLYLMAVGRILPNGERDLIGVLFFVFVQQMSTFAFLVIAALSYRDKVDRSTFTKITK